MAVLFAFVFALFALKVPLPGEDSQRLLYRVCLLLSIAAQRKTLVRKSGSTVSPLIGFPGPTSRSTGCLQRVTAVTIHKQQSCWAQNCTESLVKYCKPFEISEVAGIVNFSILFLITFLAWYDWVGRALRGFLRRWHHRRNHRRRFPMV